MKLTFCIILMTIGIVLALMAFTSLATYAIFTKFPQYTVKTYGDRKATRHKKNATLLYVKRINGPIHSYTIKNLTKTTYKYKAGEKSYKIKLNYFFTTPAETDYIVSVIYLKIFPRIAYIESDPIGSFTYLIWGLVSLAISFSCIFVGFNII